MRRIELGVTRPMPIAIEVDGASVMVYPGETVAVAVLAANTHRFRDDRSREPRGMFCNMGTCSECTVWIAATSGSWRRLRSCLVPVEPALRIATRDPEHVA